MSKRIRVKAADYTSVDADYDLLHKGCIKTNGRTIKFLYGHNRNLVLGNVIDLKEEDDGLYATIELADESKIPILPQALYELEAKLVDKMSIGFSYNEYVYNKELGHFDVTDISLYEVSMTPIPCNNETAYLGMVEDNESNTDSLLQALNNLVSGITNISNN